MNCGPFNISLQKVEKLSMQCTMNQKYTHTVKI